MGTITNKTRRPLSVPLPEGKTLRLGPLASAELSPKAARHPALQKLVEAGSIEIEDGPSKRSMAGPKSGGSTRSAGGHGAGGGIRKAGDR